jgi:hypothetical protein
MSLRDRYFGNFKGDLFGGLTAGIVALPLALGFGVASGVENGAAAAKAHGASKADVLRATQKLGRAKLSDMLDEGGAPTSTP